MAVIFPPPFTIASSWNSLPPPPRRFKASRRSWNVRLAILQRASFALSNSRWEQIGGRCMESARQILDIEDVLQQMKNLQQLIDQTDEVTLTTGDWFIRDWIASLDCYLDSE